jgi:hypothetical protein
VVAAPGIGVNVQINGIMESKRKRVHHASIPTGSTKTEKEQIKNPPIMNGARAHRM